MAAIQVRSLFKQFGSLVAVDHVTLEIAEGEFVVLLGPSGCGKTTTLRLIAGLEAATSGQILIGDQDVTHLHPRERGCAMVFQDYALYPHMTVKDNLSFGLRNLRYAKSEIELRVKEVSDMLQIGNLLERKPRQLSGGQRQRVALGRAIVRRPQVYLFDEPLSNLDAKLRAAMRVELAELHARLGTTSVYVTHDQVEAMTLGTRIIVMKDGVLQQVATAADLYNRPANMFVANFIGSPPMNLVSGRLVREDGLAVQVGPVRLAIPPAYHARYQAFVDQPVTFGLRPEDICAAGSQANTNAWAQTRVHARVVEQLGKEVLVYFKLADQDVIASLPPDSVAHPEEFDLLWNMDKMHLFDSTTGQTIQ
jgi:multiple sugar transport system ATP-binding protein